jgi:hypothetical protein
MYFPKYDQIYKQNLDIHNNNPQKSIHIVFNFVVSLEMVNIFKENCVLLR